MAAVILAAASLSRRRSSSRRLSIARPSSSTVTHQASSSAASNIFRRSSTLIRSKRRDYALLDVLGDEENWQGSSANLTGYLGPASSDAELLFTQYLESCYCVGFQQGITRQVTLQQPHRQDSRITVGERDSSGQGSLFSKDPDLILDAGKLLPPANIGNEQGRAAAVAAVPAVTKNLSPNLGRSLRPSSERNSDPGKTMAVEREIKPDNRKRRVVFTVKTNPGQFGGSTWRISADVETLINGSPSVIQAMLSDRWTSNIQGHEDQLHIEIEDTPPEYFENVITFLEKKHIELKSIETALGTLCAARKYLVTPLCKLCIRYLLAHLVAEDDALRTLDAISRCSLSSSQDQHDERWVPSAPPVQLDGDDHHADCWNIPSAAAAAAVGDMRLNNVNAPAGCPSEHAAAAAAAGEDDPELCRLVSHLKAHCLKVVASNAQQLLGRDFPWEDTGEDVVRELLSMDTLSVPNEATVFEAVLSWGARRCREKGLEVTPDNRRCCIPDAILFSVRFLTLNPEQLSRLRMSLVEFTTEEELFITKYVDCLRNKQPLPIHEAPPHMAQYMEGMARRRVGTVQLEQPSKRKKKNSGTSLFSGCWGKNQADDEDPHGYQPVPDGRDPGQKDTSWKKKADNCIMCAVHCVAFCCE